MWFSTIRNWSGEMDEGDYGYFVMMHETCHALGLIHSFDADLTGVEDSERYTVMAYDNNPWCDLDASSFMLYDIAALQSIYGANTSYNNGDTTYVLDPNSAYTIWDGGGIDTFDASAQTSSVILSLEEGAFSSVGLVDDVIRIEHTGGDWVDAQDMIDQGHLIIV